jgi:methionyl-tRNA formyltransferase
MRVAFCGTPDFAIPCLDAVVTAGHDVALVVSQPDRKRGRRARPSPTPLRARAACLDLETRSLDRGARDEVYAELVSLELDATIVVAFGHIIREPLLSAGRFGCLNVHASLLPRWRGPAPIHRAIVAGDRETGVCTMRLAAGVDTGDVYLARSTQIDPNESVGELHDRLAQLGGEALVETLAGLEGGWLQAQPQSQEGITYAPMLEKCEGSVDFTLAATRVHDRLRGMDAWPGIAVLLEERRVRLSQSRVAQAEGVLGQAGTVLAIEESHMLVACGEGSVAVSQLQPSGKRAMTPAEFERGSALQVGAVLRATDDFCPREEDR